MDLFSFNTELLIPSLSNLEADGNPENQVSQLAC